MSDRSALRLVAVATRENLFVVNYAATWACQCSQNTWKTTTLMLSFCWYRTGTNCTSKMAPIQSEIWSYTTKGRKTMCTAGNRPVWHTLSISLYSFSTASNKSISSSDKTQKLLKHATPNQYTVSMTTNTT